MKHTMDFTKGPIIGPLLKFSMPILFALFLQALYGAVDLMVVGKFALAQDVSGVAIGSQIMHTVTGLISSLAMGTTILLGQKLGEGNEKLCGRIIGTSIVLFFAAGLALTLLIPLFGMLFIRSVMLGKEEKLWKKIGWGVMFGLVIFNLIGSASSGGFLGMAAVVVLALILLNKKILKWWKPLLILILIAGICFGVTVDRWLPELTGAAKSVTAAIIAKKRGKIFFIRIM